MGWATRGAVATSLGADNTGVIETATINNTAEMIFCIALLEYRPDQTTRLSAGQSNCAARKSGGILTKVGHPRRSPGLQGVPRVQGKRVATRLATAPRPSWHLP